MNVQKELRKTKGFDQLSLLASQVVEGFISGLHKSPFHGFSAEFAEHKIYNPGESTKHIDWKLFARTDKLYTKQYEEETNLRCHLIIDNSSSMHYPAVSKPKLENLNKIAFSVLAAAVITSIMKRQRDAVGLSIYSDQYDFYAPEKSNARHHNLLLNALHKILTPSTSRQTKTHTCLHQISEKLKRRSLVFLFTDMLQESISQAELFEALRHLKYNKHQVVLFHCYDGKTERNFDFDNTPKRFIDKETGEKIGLFPAHVKTGYAQAVQQYFKALELQCLKYKIKYIPTDIHKGFDNIITTYLLESRKFS